MMLMATCPSHAGLGCVGRQAHARCTLVGGRAATPAQRGRARPRPRPQQRSGLLQVAASYNNNGDPSRNGKNVYLGRGNNDYDDLAMRTSDALQRAKAAWERVEASVAAQHTLAMASMARGPRRRGDLLGPHQE